MRKIVQLKEQPHPFGDVIEALDVVLDFLDPKGMNLVESAARFNDDTINRLRNLQEMLLQLDYD